MKIKVIVLLFFALIVSVRSQTYITGSNTIICAGETTTLTAHHDWLHYWCYWTPAVQSNTMSSFADYATISPSVTTTYTVKCYDVDAHLTIAVYTQTVSLCVGILSGHLEKMNINFYPNPSKGLIEITGLEKNSEIEIYNATGTIIFGTISDDEKKQIDLSDYNAGIYFIKINTGRQEMVKKIIKE